MNKQRQLDFSRRITQANRTELLVIVYDIILEELNCAQKDNHSGDMNLFRHDLRQVQKYLSHLMGTLEYNYPISVNLLSLYEYIQRILIKCDITGSTEGISTASDIISRLKSAFETIAPLDRSAPIMENTQSVYAGLTYKRFGISEISLDPDSAKRGFLA